MTRRWVTSRQRWVITQAETEGSHRANTAGAGATVIHTDRQGMLHPAGPAVPGRPWPARRPPGCPALRRPSSARSSASLAALAGSHDTSCSSHGSCRNQGGGGKRQTETGQATGRGVRQQTGQAAQANSQSSKSVVETSGAGQAAATDNTARSTLHTNRRTTLYLGQVEEHSTRYQQNTLTDPLQVCRPG